jgi:hypothetical protein
MLLEKVGIKGVVGVRFVLMYSFRLVKSVLKGLEEGEDRMSVIELEKDGEG